MGFIQWFTVHSWLLLGSNTILLWPVTETAQWHCVKTGFCAVTIWAGNQRCSSSHLSASIFVIVVGWGPAVARRTAGTQPTCTTAACVVDAAGSVWACGRTSSSVSHCQKQYVLQSQLLSLHSFLSMLHAIGFVPSPPESVSEHIVVSLLGCHIHLFIHPVRYCYCNMLWTARTVLIKTDNFTGLILELKSQGHSRPLRSNIVNTISHELLEQSWWRWQVITTTHYWWPGYILEFKGQRSNLGSSMW